MKNKKIIVILAAVVVLLVVAALAVVVKNKFVKNPEPIISRDSVKPVIPPKAREYVPPKPIDINKLQPPKKLEIPQTPPKLPQLPPNVPTHIDIESLKAPQSVAPVIPTTNP